MRHGRGWTRAGEYRLRTHAIVRAEELKPKFKQVRIQTGTKGAAFFKPKKVYRVWVR